jgi:transposase
LPLIPAGLLVVQVLPTGDHLTIITSTPARHRSADCPSCGQPSRRVHSSYDRRLHDLPWQGRPVTLRVRVRRFRCLLSSCPRRTFAERLPGIAGPAARRTERLGELHYHIGLALGGEAGARLTQRLAMPASPDTLLRLVCSRTATPPAGTPRVLGVDDWAFRRGHRYGTILVDLERNAVVDLLPDRHADTLAAWLRAHPGIEVITRDRAGAYADGARQGAPAAIQVTDRWHLLRNLGDAVRAVVDKHDATARRIARSVAAKMPSAASVVERTAVQPTAAERRRQQAFARRQARYEEAARLHDEGVPLRRIAAMLGVDPRTVQAWLHAGHAPLRHRQSRGTTLDPYRDHLERRWAEGCRNAAQLWRELVGLGFSGRPSTVRVWTGRRRKADPAGGAPGTGTSAKGRWRPPSGHRLTRLLMSDPAEMPDADRSFVMRLLAEEPALAATVSVGRRLAAVLRRDSDESLHEVLTAARNTLLVRLAESLARDGPAVQAALDLPWTTSPAEGHINRLKMIKRTMYGRAGFRLLRQRVLHVA